MLRVITHRRMWHCFHQYAEGAGVADGDTTTDPKPMMEALVATQRIGRWVNAQLDASLAAKL